VGERPSRPTSILVVSNHGAIVGGGELSLLDLLRGLDRDRWAPVLVVPEEGEVGARGRDLDLPVHVIPLPTLRRPGPRSLRSVKALTRLARATDAAVIHANGSRAMAYAGVAGRLAARPALWHVRIADRDGLMDRALSAIATVVIATSRAVARRLAWAQPKIRLVPNGIDLKQFTPRPPSAALRAKLGVPPSARVAVSIGRHVPEKGYRHLVDAAALIERAQPGVHWVLVGNGELRSELEAQTRRLGLASQVHFTGWRDDVADVRKTLFTGWYTNDTHAGPSNLRYGLDNWIWGMVGYAGFVGEIGGSRFSFRQGFYRFKPDGSQMEFIRNTSNNSWGVGISEEGNIFGSTANGNPSMHMPIPNRYYESVRGWSSSVLGMISESARMYPITDKVRQVDHHGNFTAGAGHALYTARTYPHEYWNRTAFVTEPTGHCVTGPEGRSLSPNPTAYRSQTRAVLDALQASRGTTIANRSFLPKSRASSSVEVRRSSRKPLMSAPQSSASFAVSTALIA